MYVVLKHLHLTLIVGAVLMFMLRVYWAQTGAIHARNGRVRQASGLLNGLVVLSGVLLGMVLDLNPLNNGIPWLSEKLSAVLAVAFLGMMALRLARSTSIRWFAFLGALGWIFFIAKLAVQKQANLFG